MAESDQEKMAAGSLPLAEEVEAVARRIEEQLPYEPLH
jgi:hypothetical protein